MRAASEADTKTASTHTDRSRYHRADRKQRSPSRRDLPVTDRDRRDRIAPAVSARRIGFLSGHQPGDARRGDRDDPRQQSADLVFTPAIATWAIFAPVFVPLFVQLAVDPAAVLAAYRVGDGPINSITPLNPYFALVVGFAQKYDRDAGVGTVVALMLPYVVWMFAVWIVLFIAWYLLGVPWGV